MKGTDLNPMRSSKICGFSKILEVTHVYGKLVFAQLMAHLPMKAFRCCVQRYAGNHKVKSFRYLDQFLCMAFAQLTYRESLRDTEICLRSQSEKLYHMGIRGGISRNTLSNANKVRDWKIYADFAVYPFFHGCGFVPPSQRSNSTPCSICVAISPPSSIYRMASFTTSTCSIV